MTKLLKDNVKTLWNPRKNTNRSRINVHEQEIKGLYKESKHTTRQINDVSFKVQRTGKKNKQRNKEIPSKIHKSPIRRLRQMVPNLGVRI